jgi:uncharacterized damage-inducible protein DinB
MSEQPEVWLRGPIAGVDPWLMPAAHALLQTYEDVERAVADLSIGDLWRSIGGAASLGFHLRHLSGSTDRLFTYARGERLNDVQRAFLAAEKQPSDNPPDAATLLAELRRTIDACIERLRATSAASLQDVRTVGRAASSTALGLLFHAAEHSQRHAGQIVTTAMILRALGASKSTDEVRFGVQ